MALTDDERAALTRMRANLYRDTRGHGKHLGFNVLDAYFDGEQRLEQLGLAVPEDLQRFVTIVAWPATYVEAITKRQKPRGFRMPGESGADEELARIWQANKLDLETSLGRTDARVFGRSYICNGSNPSDDNTPLVTVESPREMIHEQHPATRKTLRAARFYTDDRDTRAVYRATFYGPDETTHALLSNKGWEEATDDEFARDTHGLGEVPVIPVVNNARVHRRYGRSTMLRIITLVDAAARALTNAQIATEALSVPQRYAAGISMADFQDPQTKEQLTQWEAYFGAIWATANKDAKFGQFTAADLSNFSGIVTHYGQLVAGVTGLPLRYFGQATTNPPNAEGTRADEQRLVLDVGDYNLSDGEAYEEWARNVLRFKGYAADPDLLSMETLWGDPATPTLAQTTDAAIKKAQIGLISKRQALRDCGYTDVQIEQILRELTDEASDPILSSLVRDVTGANNANANGGTGALPGAAGGNGDLGNAGA